MNVRHSLVLMQLIDPLELFVKRRKFLSGSIFLPRRDMIKAVESDVKPIDSFLLYHQHLVCRDALICCN